MDVAGEAQSGRFSPSQYHSLRYLAADGCGFAGRNCRRSTAILVNGHVLF